MPKLEIDPEPPFKQCFVNKVTDEVTEDFTFLWRGCGIRLTHEDSCKVCGARRIWLSNQRGGFYPSQIEAHKQATEIDAMLEDQRIAREQEQKQQIAIEILTQRKKKKVEG